MIGTGMGMLLAGLAAGGAQAYGAHRQGQASTRASAATTTANAEALRFEREQAAADQRRFDAEQTAKREQWAADEAFRQNQYRASEEDRLFQRMLLEQQEARRAPFREASRQALGRVGDILGIRFDTAVRPPLVAAAGTPLAAGGAPVSSARPRPMLPGPVTADPRGAARPATEASYAPVTPTYALPARMRVGDLVQYRRRMA